MLQGSNDWTSGSKWNKQPKNKQTQKHFLGATPDCLWKKKAMDPLPDIWSTKTFWWGQTLVDTKTLTSIDIHVHVLDRHLVKLGKKKKGFNSLLRKIIYKAFNRAQRIIFVLSNMIETLTGRKTRAKDYYFDHLREKQNPDLNFLYHIS